MSELELVLNSLKQNIIFIYKFIIIFFSYLNQWMEITDAEMSTFKVLQSQLFYFLRDGIYHIWSQMCGM